MKIGVSGQLEGTHEAKFHLLIDKKAMMTATALEENKTQAAAARIHAERRVNNAVRNVNAALEEADRQQRAAPPQPRP